MDLLITGHKYTDILTSITDIRKPNLLLHYSELGENYEKNNAFPIRSMYGIYYIYTPTFTIKINHSRR